MFLIYCIKEILLVLCYHKHIDEEWGTINRESRRYFKYKILIHVFSNNTPTIDMNPRWHDKWAQISELHCEQNASLVSHIMTRNWS